MKIKEWKGKEQNDNKCFPCNRNLNIDFQISILQKDTRFQVPKFIGQRIACDKRTTRFLSELCTNRIHDLHLSVCISRHFHLNDPPRAMPKEKRDITIHGRQRRKKYIKYIGKLNYVKPKGSDSDKTDGISFQSRAVKFFVHGKFKFLGLKTKITS